MNPISLVILTLVVLFVIFRRARALLTRQKIQPTSMRVRMAIFLGLGVVVLVFALGQPLTLGSAALGLICGVGLAWSGLRLTLIEHLPDGTYYTPNKYIGLAVLGVFLLRFVYKIAETISTVSATAPPPGTLPGGNPLAQIGGDPLTTGAYFILIGYYVCYYAVLLLRVRTPNPTP